MKVPLLVAGVWGWGWIRWPLAVPSHPNPSVILPFCAVAESEVASFVKQTCERMKSFPAGRSVCGVFEVGSTISYFLPSRHLSFMMLSESQGIHVISCLSGVSPPLAKGVRLRQLEQKQQFYGAGGSPLMAALSQEQEQDGTSPEVCSELRCTKCRVVFSGLSPWQSKLSEVTLAQLRLQHR